jgi:hypothetical protein
MRYGQYMTYNFDPERWYDNERAFLNHEYQSGKMTDQAYVTALKILEDKLDEMWERLDRSYLLSGSG